jgi:hypothetical protein
MKGLNRFAVQHNKRWMSRALIRWSAFPQNPG